jgi:MFS family permease
MKSEKLNLIKQKIESEKTYKGPIIEIRGIIRLIFACLPFLIGVYYFKENELWRVGFLCAAFTSASYVGIENNHRKIGYSIWVMIFVGLAVSTVWAFSDSIILISLGLIAWSLVSSMSFAAGPVVSLPVNIGMILYVLFLLNNNLAGQGFWESLFFAGCGVLWSYLLGYIRFLRPVKNEIEIPKFEELKNNFNSSLTWQSPYIRNGLARGVIVVIIGSIAAITQNSSLIITAFTVIIAMLPGKNQTRFKIMSRVAAAMGAIIAANILINFKPPFWIYIVGFIFAIAFTRWIILRSYTYNSFFLITFPLFLISLGGYYDNSWNKLWYTILGAIISIIASELFVFKKRHLQKDML